MSPADRHKAKVAAAGCVLGNRRLHACIGRVELHHVGEGSGKRSAFALVGLCEEGHRGGSGLHGMGLKAFLRLYKLPTEYHLLIWANEDIARSER